MVLGQSKFGQSKFWWIREHRAAFIAAGASLSLTIAVMGTALAFRAPPSTPLADSAQEAVAPSPQVPLPIHRDQFPVADDAKPVEATVGKLAAAYPVTQELKPQESKPRAMLDTRPDSLREIFGTASIEVSNARITARWEKVISEAADSLLTGRCTAGEICKHPLFVRLREEVKTLRALNAEARIAAVNVLVNRSFRFASDAAVYGVPDHWATLAQFISHGEGDCEDFAIAKMWLLAAAGVPKSIMRLVVLRDTIGRVDHAVLVVSIDGKNFVLDNRIGAVLRDAEMKHYRPFYSLSALGTAWVHSIPQAPQPATVASMVSQ